MKSYVFVGPHPDVLNPDGRPLALDQVVKNVDLKDPHNQRLVDEGWLIEHTPDPANEQPKSPTSGRRNPDPDPEA